MRSTLSEMLRVFARHARREFLRGPLGAPFISFRHRRVVQHVTLLSSEPARKLWNGLEALDGFHRGTRKLAFRALYNAPFGPGDASAPQRVYRRHVELVRRLGAATA